MNPRAARRLPRPETLAWPALCALLGLGSLCAWFLGPAMAMAWHAERWQHTPWVMWTAALVHLSGAHLAANLGALALLAVFGVILRAGWPAVLGVLAAWPLSTCALALWPQIGGYSGMSGLLHAMVAVLWSHALAHTAKPLSFAIFALLLVKLMGEHAWSQPIAFDPNWGFNVVYAAHLSGALVGAACGLLAMAIARLLGPRLPPARS